MGRIDRQCCHDGQVDPVNNASERVSYQENTYDDV